MNLSSAFNRSPIGMGVLDVNVIKPQATINAVVKFVFKNLPLWFNDQIRPCDCSENKLNSSLCDFLDVEARDKFNLIRFHHEQPEKGQRRVDMSIKAAQRSGIEVSGCTYSIYEPFFVIEGKRLFTSSDKKREREYVTGEDGASSGGIQRFKLGAHGSTITDAALIGYVQKYDFNYWFEKINQWIDDLTNESESKNIGWSIEDKLNEFSIEGQISKSTSVNERNKNGLRNSITLYHLWINMMS
jgi:hypothetical protein